MLFTLLMKTGVSWSVKFAVSRPGIVKSIIFNRIL